MQCSDTRGCKIGSRRGEGSFMSRNIVLLSDGTGNSAAKVWRTNVWRTFEALDLSGNDQVAFYDDGVGTSSFKPMAILGGAFGFGLKRNVIDHSPAATTAIPKTRYLLSALVAAPSRSASSSASSWSRE